MLKQKKRQSCMVSLDPISHLHVLGNQGDSLGVDHAH